MKPAATQKLIAKGPEGQIPREGRAAEHSNDIATMGGAARWHAR